MGSALEVFDDFAFATDYSILRGPRDLVNEAVKNSYLLRRFLRGNDYSDVIQGGRTIRDQIMFDEESTRRHYHPNETQSPQNPQVLDEWEIPWRFIIDHMTWTDQEIGLNVTGMSREARHRMYKDLKHLKERRLWTSTINGMEDDIFRTPSNIDMEVTAGKVPYSLPVFISDGPNGLPGGFSTVEGISSATQPRWRPQYDNTTWDDGPPSDAGWKLWEAFDEMEMLVQFDTLPGKEEFGTKTSGAYFIATSKRGKRVYKRGLRMSQDTFVTTSRQDPAYSNPKFSGIDIVYVSNLNTAAVYDDGAGGFQDETGTTGPGVNLPRYWWINGTMVHPVFHTERYMYKKKPMVHPLQPTTTVMYVDCWMNFVCRSRQRLGLVGGSMAV